MKLIDFANQADAANVKFYPGTLQCTDPDWPTPEHKACLVKHHSAFFAYRRAMARLYEANRSLWRITDDEKLRKMADRWRVMGHPEQAEAIDLYVICRGDLEVLG